MQKGEAGEEKHSLYKPSTASTGLFAPRILAAFGCLAVRCVGLEHELLVDGATVIVGKYLGNFHTWKRVQPVQISPLLRRSDPDLVLIKLNQFLKSLNFSNRLDFEMTNNQNRVYSSNNVGLRYGSVISVSRNLCSQASTSVSNDFLYSVIAVVVF